MKQFELEDAIMQAWHTVNDIDLILDSCDEQSRKALSSVRELANYRFSKLFDVYEESLKPTVTPKRYSTEQLIEFWDEATQAWISDGCTDNDDIFGYVMNHIQNRILGD
jgi:hypothetical protein